MRYDFRPAIALMFGLFATLAGAQTVEPEAHEQKPLILSFSETLSTTPSVSSPARPEYKLAAGDAIKVQVYQNPDLTVEARVSESGSISYPLVGSITVGGMSIGQAERAIAAALEQGQILKQPQVNIVLLQVRGNQVSVLGQVQRPGRFPLETTTMRVSDVLALAGGVTHEPGQVR